MAVTLLKETCVPLSPLSPDIAPIISKKSGAVKPCFVLLRALRAEHFAQRADGLRLVRPLGQNGDGLPVAQLGGKHAHQRFGVDGHVLPLEQDAGEGKADGADD